MTTRNRHGFDGEPPRDKPLSFHWKAEYQDLNDRVGLPWADRKNTRKTIAAVFLDAALEAKGHGRAISYSRRQEWWIRSRRYVGSTFRRESVIHAVEALAAMGLLIDHQIAPAGRDGTGRQSTFRPAPELAGVDLPPTSYVPGELIRLRDADKQLVDYRETVWTLRERRFLIETNEFIASATIQLDAPHVVRDGMILRCGDDHVLYPAMTALYRVFNVDWAHGGRFYGGWWQQARKADRLCILIDGEPVVEVDYEALHPRLLYALAGRTLDGPAYELPGWERQHAKLAFNVLLNAGRYPDALGSLARHLAEAQTDTGEPVLVRPEHYKRAAVLIDDTKARHAPVADHFHTGVGLRLQRTDAGMARVVLGRTRRQGIVGLPVHDSFMVAERHEGRLREAMDEAGHKAGINAVLRVFSNTSVQNRPHKGVGDGAGVSGASRPYPCGLPPVVHS
jgi:hypothetical protein